jgi:hypothetical protein
MCDPFFALILTENLGPDYVVWDKEAAIRFLRPGRGTVRARFEITPQRIEEIRTLVDDVGRALVTFTSQVIGEDGVLVAEVDKVESVRKKTR